MDKEVNLKKAAKKGEPDVEIEEPEMSDSEDDESFDEKGIPKEKPLNSKNLYKFNNLLSQYL